MPNWKNQGVRIVKAGEMDPNTPQTPGMNRAVAINHAMAGANKLWAGTVTIHPDAKTGAHHHGELESVIYVVNGKARMRWGGALEYVAEAGDFIYIPRTCPIRRLTPVKTSRSSSTWTLLPSSRPSPYDGSARITPIRRTLVESPIPRS